MRRTGEGLLCTLCAGLLLLASSGALAQAGPEARKLRAHYTGDRVELGLSFVDVADAAVRRKLMSGLPQVVTTRILAYDERGQKPLSAAVLSCRVVYDLWETRFRVQVQDTLHDRSYVEKDVDGVIERCFRLPRLSLAVTDGMRGRRVYFAALTELNPLSRQTVRRIRRWLSRSGSGMGNDAFFGSFVSIFVSHRLGEAERTVTFRSKVVKIP